MSSRRSSAWIPAFAGMTVSCVLCVTLMLITVGCRSPSARTDQSTSAPRTTDGAIALANLDAEIGGLEKTGARRSLRAAEASTLIDLIITRARLLGRVSDYERALVLGDEVVAAHPEDGQAFLARARARAALHRFAEATEDLDRASRLGARAVQVDAARASVLQATGQLDQALAIRRRHAERRPSIQTLGALASALAASGNTGEAAQTFAVARERYRDVSPFPVCWLLFEEGLMWLQHDEPARARERFAEAHARLPGYAAAQGHLAEAEAVLGNQGRAIALLTPLAQSSEDPDYAAQLARILTEAGRAPEAAPWRAQAEQRYATLLAAHPAAFADHGAELYLFPGGDPQRALALARLNVRERQTPRAYELLATAALAAGDTQAACDAAQRHADARALVNDAGIPCTQPPTS